MKKNSSKKLISVVIPCLNEAGVVNVLVEQLLAQANEKLEIIVVDNGSTDQTLTILNGYKSRGVTVVSGVLKGVSRARNAGARVAVGEWIAFLDADTELPNNFVQKLVVVLETNPQFELAALGYKAATKNLLFKLLTAAAQAYQRISYKINHIPLVPGAVVLVKKQVHINIGGFNEEIRYNEDFEYSKRAYKACKTFKALRSPYVYFSVRRLQNGGWRAVITTYFTAEFARIRGKKYDPAHYDMSDHTMKKP